MQGEDHPDYTHSLNDVAGLYYSMQAYEKAEPFYLEALQVTKKIKGEEHADYVTSLNRLAGLYYAMEAYEKAEPLYIEALKIQEHKQEN
jgi:tetratricopeptide (TPR) repeat protein